MASSKVMASSKPKNSDLASTSSSSAASRSRRFTSSSSSPSPSLSATKHPSSDRSTTVLRPMSSSSNMTVDGILSNVYSGPSSETTLLDGQITLIDGPAPPVPSLAAGNESSQLNGGSDDQEMAIAEGSGNKTVDDMWREIVSGRKELKEEPDEMMTLEDFLARAGAVEVGEDDDDEVKMPQLASERLSGGGVFAAAFDPVPPPNAIHMLDKVEGSIVGFGNEAAAVAAPSFGGLGVGRGKRGRAPPALEQLDKAAQQRQKRMIKNRESAARSRERKQAYQVELESLAVKLEEENEQLLREKEERTKERLKQLMEKVVPVVERRKPPPTLRRARSWVW